MKATSLLSRWCLPFRVQSCQKTVLSAALLNHLEGLKVRHNLLAVKLESPDLSPMELRVSGKKYSELGRVVLLLEERAALKSTISDCSQMEKEEKVGSELFELARSERLETEDKLEALEEVILRTVIPKDDDDGANSTVLEVRAGTGGDEASLFAGEIFKMYEKYADIKGWKWELLSLTRTEIGGFKEAQASMSGDDVFKVMKYESGVHRVQRIPVNDVKIQTSAASVIVLPEPEEVEVELRPQDLRIDVYRAGGAGGQSVNRTESAVRITHLPTGLAVAMQVTA